MGHATPSNRDDSSDTAPGGGRVLLLVWLTMILIAVVALVFSDRLVLYKGPVSARFDGRQFDPAQLNSRPSLARMLTWQSNRTPSTWPNRVSLRRRAVPPLRYSGDGIQVTRIGHSTVLIQVDGLNLITDPVLDDQLAFFGGLLDVDAVAAPGVAFDDLPPIDVVLISHDHPDHLDRDSLLRLWRRDDPLMLVPLGVDARLRGWADGIRTQALDWWQTYPLGDSDNPFEATFVPARHWSGRGVFDHNRTLWGGWMLDSSEGRIYFAGDTGYAPSLAQHLAARFAPIRLALLPIGGYEPAELMDGQNLSPSQALAVHFQLDAEQSIAMHYGRFQLTDESFHDPVEQLKRARREAGLAQDRFLILPPGRLLNVE